MKWRGTLFLLILAAGLFAYIVFFERQRPDPTAVAAAAARLIPGFEPAKVQSIEIFGTNSVVRLERTNSTWRLLQPVVYPAQTTVIETWLQVLAALNRRASISASELISQPGGPAAFGLEPPEYTVNLNSSSGSVRLRLGGRTPMGEKMYVQFVGAEGAHVTESALLDRMPRNPSEWRDPGFIHLENVAFNRLTVRSGPRDFELQRDTTNGFWRLTRPRPARANNALFLQLMQQLLHTRIEEFVNDVPGGDLEPYGLQTPEVELSFAQGTNTALTIAFGGSPTNQSDRVYAHRSSLPGVVTVARDLSDRLHLPYTDLLDRRLAEVNPANVNRMDLLLRQPVTVVRITNNIWRVTHPVDFAADTAIVTNFLQSVASLAFADVAKEVVTDLDLPTYGLAPPQRQLTLRGGDSPGGTNQLLAQLDFGNVQGHRIFVRRSDETPVYSALTNDVMGLPGSPFEFRDRQILSFTTNQVQALSITLKDKTWKLLRSPAGQWSFAAGSQGIVNTWALEEAMHRFGRLRARAWVDSGETCRKRYGIPQAAHEITIIYQSGDTTNTNSFAFGGPSPSGGPFAATTLEVGDVVFDFPAEIYLDSYAEVVRNLTATP